MPRQKITPEKREKWLSQFDSDTRARFENNPFIEGVLQRYMADIIHRIKTGNNVAKKTTEKSKENVKENVKENNGDKSSSDPEMPIKLFSESSDEDEDALGGLFD